VRRVFWLAVGLGAGATTAVLVSRWMKEQRQRLAPANLGKQAMGGLSSLGDRVNEAVREFRRGAAEKEAEIKASLPE
jgi:hypothetical protein